VDETPPVIRKNIHLTVLAIGTARVGAYAATEIAAKEGLRISLFHQVWLSPLAWPEGFLDSLRESKRCLIVDADYVEWSTASTLAMKLYKLGATEVECLGLEPRSAGFSDTTDNRSPSPARILAAVKAFAY
jgi:pyruvate/2-oxoglutarate/acetoin dehydrogenase E1 component